MITPTIIFDLIVTVCDNAVEYTPSENKFKFDYSSDFSRFYRAFSRTNKKAKIKIESTDMSWSPFRVWLTIENCKLTAVMDENTLRSIFGDAFVDTNIIKKEVKTEVKTAFTDKEFDLNGVPTYEAPKQLESSSFSIED